MLVFARLDILYSKGILFAPAGFYALTNAARRKIMIYALVVGLISGWAAGKIMKGGGYGIIVDIILGLLGGFVGSWLLSILGFATSGGIIADVIVGIIGAVILVGITRLIKKA